VKKAENIGLKTPIIMGKRAGKKGHSEKIPIDA